jgi:hypothetical protein
MYHEENYESLYNNKDSRKDNVVDDIKNIDKGYNVIYRMVERPDGKIKRKKIDIYTSGDTGHRIRDAATGEYYQNLVGSQDEDLFFKVGLSTGECKSANGSNTLFFLSPAHYANHLHCSVNENFVDDWQIKRRVRTEQLNKTKKSTISSIV